MIRDHLKTKREGTHFCIPLCNPVSITKSYKTDMRLIHPYVIGVFIGDGCFSASSANRISYSGTDKEIDDNIRSTGYEVIERQDERSKSIVFDGALKELKRLFGEECYSIDKFIPGPYLYGTKDDRMELLKGLIDTDGYVDSRGHMSYSTISERLANDFAFLVRSLGGKATIKKNAAGYKDKGGEYIKCNDCYTVYFNTKFNKEITGISRKKERARKTFR